MPRNQWVKIADEAIEWYWTYGKERKDAHLVSAGWLTDLYNNRNLLDSSRNAFNEFKPCLALWGSAA